MPGSHSLILSAAVQEVVNHRSAPGQGCLLPTVFTPRAGSALPVTFKGSAWGQPRHPKSSCLWCLLLRVPWDKAFCSNTAASETAAYKYSCAESHFLRLNMQVMEKAIFCLCEIFKHPEAERKAYTLQRLTAQPRLKRESNGKLQSYQPCIFKVKTFIWP